jgi:hypothetical protein
MKDLGVEEVRKARHQISEECDHDLHRVVAYYKEVEEELRRVWLFWNRPRRARVQSDSRVS